MSLERGAASPDIATEVKEHVTPDELFGPMSPRKGHGYTDGTINKEKYEGNGDVFRDTDLNPSSPINNPETFLTSNSRMETSTKEGVVNNSPYIGKSTERENGIGRSNKDGVAKDSPYPDKSAEAEYGGSQSNQYSNNTLKDSPASFKVSSMSVNNENVNRVRSRLHRDRNSQNGFSSRSSYLHVNIFDDNLNISDSKLDNTLLRLFSRNSNLIGHYTDFDNPIESHNFSHSDFIGLEPVAWRVYPMNAAHKETLDRELDFLAFHLKPREIISRLYKDGILTSLDYNQMARTAAQGDRAVTRLLIRTLQRRGAKAYPALINALIASDYLLICERLSESEHELKSGLLTDRVQRGWNGLHTTPNRFHTPYLGTSPDYAFKWSVFPNPPLFSSNQNFPANETWPQANQRSLIDHVSPLYNTMPANHLVTPDGRDSQTLGTLRQEHRLNDIDRSLKMIHQDIASLRSDSRTHHNTRTTGRDSEAHTSLGQQEILHEHLQQQMNDLHRKMKKVHNDIATLKGRDSVRDFPLLNYEHVRESTNGRRIIDAELLDSHLGALGSEIKMLHNDVTSLKMARSFSVHTDRTHNSTSRGLRNSTSRRHLDEPYLSPTRQSRLGDRGRGTIDGSYSDVIPGLLPHTGLPRYPSRYSPQFVYTGQYPDTARSTSRADNVNRNSRNKTKIDAINPATNSRDSSHNKSRSPDKKDENKRSLEIYDRPHNQEDDTFNNKDNSNLDLNKRHNDILLADDFKSLPNMKSSEHLEKDVLVNDGSDEIQSPVENKHNASNKYNSNNIHNNRNEENIVKDQDKDEFNSPQQSEDTSRSKSSLYNRDSRIPENTVNKSNSNNIHNNRNEENTIQGQDKDPFYSPQYDEDISWSKSRLDNRDNRMPDQRQSQRHPDDYSRNAKPQKDTQNNTAQKTKGAPYTDERAAASPAPTSVSTEHRYNPYPGRVPEIVTPERSAQIDSTPGSGMESSQHTPDNNQQPKQKKRVRYSDTSPLDNNHLTRDYRERPKSRAAHPTNSRTASKPAAIPRDDVTGTSLRPSSPRDSQSSEDQEYVRLTTPTRILSPPHGLPFERVTTPYNILRNPTNRKMTTWSKKTDRNRSIKRKGKI